MRNEKNYVDMANFEALCRDKNFSKNLLFLRHIKMCKKFYLERSVLEFKLLFYYYIWFQIKDFN